MDRRREVDTSRPAVEQLLKDHTVAEPVCATVRALLTAKAPEWQPIETAPHDREVLVYDDGAILISLWVRDEDGQEGWWDHGFMDPAPTHWQPVPAEPKEEQP